MTVKEMHVDVRDQLQRLSANRNRKLSPDQIDWNLNRAQQIMVEAAVESVEGSGRFRIKPGRTDVITGLLSGRTPLYTSWITDRYVSFLPSDFWYMLDDASSVGQICKGESKITTYSVLNITSVAFPFSTSETPYSSVELVYNNSTLINLTALLLQRQKSYTGLSSTEEHFYVRDLLMQQLAGMGISVYWEKFHTVNQPYTLLFVNNSATAIPITLKLDGVDYVGTNQQLTLEVHSTTRPSVLTANTMVSPDKGFATSSTPYFKTSYISPISEQGPSVLYTFADKSFIVYSTTINYVRKPRTISLSLGTDCQLSSSIHQHLCNKTVEMVLNRIAAGEPDWKEVAQQNAISNS